MQFTIWIYTTVSWDKDGTEVNGVNVSDFGIQTTPKVKVMVEEHMLELAL